MGSALANGDGALDHSGLLRGVERLSGRSRSELASPAEPAESGTGRSDTNFESEN